MEAEVASALRRWREVTTPLDTARVAPAHAKSTASASCRAWSREDFVRRVASFGAATWFAKPLSLSPLACARLGWVNTASDLLECESCKRVVSCKIDAKLSAKGAAAVAKRFASQLETAHESTCPWTRNPSPESFALLPLLGPSQVAQALNEQVESVHDQAKKDDALEKAVAQVELKEEALKKLFEATKTDEATLMKTLKQLLPSATNEELLVRRHATLLSVCGWMLGSKEAEVVVSCEYCCRCVPLQRSAAVEDGEAKEEREPTAPPLKRQRVNMAIDPITSHRWFCPWVVEQTRRDADDQRVREALSLVSDHSSSHESLLDFIRLPGWKQRATALRHVDSASSKPSDAATKSTPFDALASVQSVLALPESYN